MSTPRKSPWPDQPTRKLNRLAPLRPRRGSWWCYACDAAHVRENEPCGHCGLAARVSRSKARDWR
jgi:hypothetical protein